MKMNVCADYEAMSTRAAEWIAAEIRADPSLLLCAATGSTPRRTYELLVRKQQTEPHLFSRLRVLKLDEWGGLGPEDPGSCEAYLRQYLIGPLGLPEERYFGFRSDAPDPEAECRRMQQLLDDEGPTGLCILGIGTNGHLALNEPAEALQPHAHVAELEESTAQHPMLGGARSRPRYGLTLGVADLLHSRKIVLLANGEHKRAVVQRLQSEAITTRFPASFLHLHRDVVYFFDRAAAGG